MRLTHVYIICGTCCFCSRDGRRLEDITRGKAAHGEKLRAFSDSDSDDDSDNDADEHSDDDDDDDSNDGAADDETAGAKPGSSGAYKHRSPAELGRNLTFHLLLLIN